MQRFRILIMVFCLCVFVSLSHATDIYRFDMGSKDSPIWPEFTGIAPDTVYTTKTGFGWEAAGGNAVSRLPFTGGRPRPDDLCGDYVIGQTHPFLMDLPAGNYRVYTILGDIDPSFFYPATSQSITANGKTVYDEQITADNFYTQKYFFRNQDAEWRAGQPDIWQKWINPYFKPIIFDVNVETSPLKIQFSPSCRVTCMIVYPVAKAQVMETEIKGITAQRHKDFLDKYYEIPHKEDISHLSPTPEQEKLGAILFTRSYLDPIYPGSIPTPDETVKDLRAFAAPGEDEPLNFAIYPLQDLKAVNVEISDLTTADGHQIMASNVNIQRVTYSEEPYYIVSDRNSYQVEQRYLRKLKPFDYEKGVSRRVWLTVHVPEGTSAGTYQGKIKVSTASGPLAEIPVTIRVLPFKLAEMPADMAAGFYYYLPRWTRIYFRDPKHEELYWQMTAKELSFMHRYNFNSANAAVEVMPVTMADGKVQIDFSSVDKFMEIYHQAGMNAPLYWYQSIFYRVIPAAQKLAGLPPASPYDVQQFDNPLMQKYFKEIIAKIVEHAKEKNWPKFYFYVGDEYGARLGQKGVDWAKRVSELCQQVPGANFAGGMCNVLETQMIPYYTTSLMNPPVLTTENLAAVATTGRRPGLYNLGFDRLSWGFYLWKINAAANMEWVYTSGGGDPYNPFNSPQDQVAGPSMDGPIPTVKMEIMREGLDDYRYCLTLKNAIATARHSDKPGVRQEAKNAQETLDEVMSLIRADFQWYTQGGQNAEGRNANLPSSDSYDKLRWRVARAVISLQDAGGH